MTNKDLFKQAIAEAKTIREAAITNAKEALEESLTPHLKEMLAQKLQEMELLEEEEAYADNNTDPEKDQDDFLNGTLGEGEDDEPIEDEEEPVDHEEGAEEEHAEEEEDEELDPNDPDFGEKLKDLIRDIVSQEVNHEEGEEELGPEGDELPADDMTGIESDEDKYIDISELLRELEEGDESKEEEPNTLEAYDAAHDSTKQELEEAMETIQQLRGQLQEVNLLNAKLLYVNKVFKSNNLSEGQKVNVIAAFDKAETVREVKLVFETVSKNVVAKKATSIKEHTSFASKPTGTTAAPQKEVINEVSEQVLRMQKLAGIIK
jgi:hypothetical protein